MSEETWKVQASYKHGDLLQHMLNVRGETALDLKIQLSDLTTHDVLGDVVATGLTLGALTTTVPLAQPAAPAAPAPAPQWTPPPAPAPSADPWATATPAPPVNPAAPTAAPVCVHGPRQFKSGVSSKGAWQAWMCSAQKHDPTKCEPQWIR